MVQTTSPSVLILASIDATRRQLALHGEALLARTIALAADARRRLRALPGVGVIGADVLGVEAFDLTKLVVDVDGLGMTGFEVEQVLRHRFGVGPEMSDLVSLVFLVTIGDTAQSIERLVDAFATLSRERIHGGSSRAELRSSGAVVAPSELA